MKFVKPSYRIIGELDGDKIINHIEMCGRTCYKSDVKGGEGAKKFCEMIIRNGHESVLEHVSFTVRFITDRAVSHEIVRHRIASYSQESQRYCNYGTERFDDEVTFVIPEWVDEKKFKTIVELPSGQSYGRTMDKEYKYYQACSSAEYDYMALLCRGMKPQEARAVLPNCTKTELVMTANIREWRHFLKLRTSKAVHPDLRALTIPLLKKLQERIPVLFDDIEVEP